MKFQAQRLRVDMNDTSDDMYESWYEPKIYVESSGPLRETAEKAHADLPLMIKAVDRRQRRELRKRCGPHSWIIGTPLDVVVAIDGSRRYGKEKPRRTSPSRCDGESELTRLLRDSLQSARR